MGGGGGKTGGWEKEIPKGTYLKRRGHSEPRKTKGKVEKKKNVNKKEEHREGKWVEYGGNKDRT